MTTRRQIRDYLQDILEYSEKAMRFAADKPDAAALEADERTFLAIIRALEVIGEAARQIPKNFRERHPDLPWQGMTGMRDILIHAYFGVDVNVIWRTVKEELPRLSQRVRQLLTELSDE